ncbi:MAG: S-layer homology domain-containing protein [Nitrospirota bacterium]
MGKLRDKLISILKRSKGYKYLPHIIVTTAFVMSFAVVTAVNPVKGLISTLSVTSDNPHLVGYWPLDSSAEDASGNGNDGTVSGAVFVYGGHDDKALYFDGRDDVLTTELEIDESSDSSGGTFAAWVKTEAYPTWKTTERSAIISTDEGGYAWSLMLHNSNWSYYNGTEEETPDTAEAELDTWTHLAVVLDPTANNGSGASSFYVNGVKVHEGEMGYKNSSNTVRFGDSALYNENFKGRIDEIYIYDIPLSGSEVYSLYSGNEVIPNDSDDNDSNVDDNAIIIDGGNDSNNDSMIDDSANDNAIIIDSGVEAEAEVDDNDNNIIIDDGDYEEYKDKITSGICTEKWANNTMWFSDVDSSHPFFIPAMFVGYYGIFDGYSDGTFKPDISINRAETAKVVLAGFGYEIDPGPSTNAGFWDVDKNAWYMPYVYTANKYGIMTGNDDGSMSPGGTVNRAELLRIFLESANANVTECKSSPYPNVAAKSWYCKYAQFAKEHELLIESPDGNFHPDVPMTRADVAYLFYSYNKAWCASIFELVQGND